MAERAGARLSSFTGSCRHVLSNIHLNSGPNSLLGGGEKSSGGLLVNVLFTANAAYLGRNLLEHEDHVVPLQRDRCLALSGLSLLAYGTLQGLLLLKSDSQWSGCGSYTVMTNVLPPSASSAATTWIGLEPRQPR